MALFFVSVFSSSLFSQVSASQTIGCAPLQVYFTSPPGATTANWNLGTGSSTQLNPSTIYNTPGVYNVTYNGTGGSPTNAVITITVVANNVSASISSTIPANHCAPMPVNFAGTSTGGGTLYQWAFGDGGSGVGANILHPYTIGGIFNATLVVTNTLTGCVATATNGPVNVSFVPNVVVSANPGFNSCMAPFTTAFTGTNSSSGSPFTPTLTYSWNFGNSQTSTQPTPGSITYNNQGYYNVSLTVTDDNSCSGSSTVVVTVVQPTVNATVPASICVNGQKYLPNNIQIFTFSVQSSQPYTIWDMGDGYTQMVPPPLFSLTPSSVFSHTYAHYMTPGLKTLTITASIGNCIATQTKTIFVEEIVPEFSAVPPTYTCSPTLITGYTNQSTVNSSSSLTYSWTVTHWNNQVANAYGSTATHPTFTLQQGSLNPYTFYGLYKPQARLIVTSSLGCRTYTVHQFDSIRRPTAWFNKDKKQGCAPLTVRFRDSSDTHTGLYPITSYTWNNGANPPTIITGNVPPAVINPTFVYSSPGTYTPYLIINTAGGCSDISFIDTVIVVGTPTVASTFTPNLEVCAGQPFQINMSALPSSSVIQHWHAQSDDGYFSGCVSNPDPIWFLTHLGTHTFTISVSDHGCESTAAIPQTVKVTGPIVRSRYRTNCVNKKSVDFISQLQQADAAILDFGDGASYTITGNPTGTVSNVVTHSYAATGDYTATVTATNSLGVCAPYSHTMLVTVREIKADFSMVPIMCKGGFMTFTATASVDVHTGCFRGYAWSVDSFEVRQFSSPYYNDIFEEPGTHTVTLWVKDINGCGDEMTKTFIIDSPTPSFSVAANPACASTMPIQFVNTTPQSPVSSSLFIWNFNNGPPPTYQAISTTTNVADWPTRTFTATVPYQTYSVTLTASSALMSCVETYTMWLQVNNPPDAYLYPATPLTCINLPVTFNAPTGFTNVVNYDDNSSIITSTANVFVHTYTAAGFYEPILYFSDAAGCISSFTTSVDVQTYPVADFSIYPTFTSGTPGATVFCTPFITFKDKSISPYELDYYWNLNTGSPVINDSVVVSYFTPGVHTVTLTSSTPNGCGTTIGKTFAIVQPTATPVIEKSNMCFGEPLKVSIKDTNQVMAWIWYFEGGFYTDTILAGSSPSPTLNFPYQYYPAPFGSGIVSLQYYSADYMCKNTATVGIKVTVVDAGFKRNNELAAIDSAHCLNISDLFNNSSKINNSTFINGLSFNWSFGDGASSASMSPAYTYSLPGVYTVTLTVTDPQAGCLDIAVKNMTIHALPVAGIALPDSVCAGSDFALTSTTSSDVVLYSWSPKDGVTNPNTANTTVTATASTTYSLLVSSVNGCTATSGAEYVYVQQPVPVIQWDTTIVIGQPSMLNINTGPGYTYTWSPLTDLSCGHCPYPTTTSTNNVTYTVEVEDQMSCFRTVNTFSVIVDPLTSVDVPTAFTPNGDGVNDVIYVDGWGIRKLNYFRIFNRWGQLVFESTDIKVGWNGTYNGVPQNMETYVYQVSAEGYIEGSHMEKTSSFRLIR